MEHGQGRVRLPTRPTHQANAGRSSGVPAATVHDMHTAGLGCSKRPALFGAIIVNAPAPSACLSVARRPTLEPKPGATPPTRKPLPAPAARRGRGHLRATDRLKRIARLEARQPRPGVARHLRLGNVIEGRPYSVLPAPHIERTEAQETAYRLYTQEADRVTARLDADDPGGAAGAQADRERRLVANLRQLERERDARELRQ
jgi:hypothetical protein